MGRNSGGITSSGKGGSSGGSKGATEKGYTAKMDVFDKTPKGRLGCVSR